MKKLLLIIFIIPFFSIQSQVVYEHLSNTAIYDFLDELANNKVIDLNSVVKPYSRMFIAGKLKEAYKHKDELSTRQQKELEFYMNAYTLELDEHPDSKTKLNIFKKNKNLQASIDPLAVLYKDKSFAFSLKPIWGIQYWSNESGNVFHRWGGAEMYGYIGKNLSFYTSLRDNHESEWLSAPTYLNRRQGVPKKGNPDGGVDYSEARGGLFYSWKWGSVGIAKDHIEWGNNYHGANILSTKPPSYGQIQLNLKPAKWFEFHYVHGWLVSETVDSSRSYWDGNHYREIFYNKYIATNMFSFTPFRRLNISFGNSIIYSDNNVQLVYLIPFLFYKSVDHTLNSTANSPGQNSQMFFDISSRQIKHLHLFLTLFIDEFKTDRLKSSDEHNMLSWKFGMKISGLFVKNISLLAEYTKTLPGPYQHYYKTLTYESNKYILGNYMKDNSEEFYIAIMYKPIKNLHFKLSYLNAEHGNDYDYWTIRNNGGAIVKYPYLKDITWRNKTYEFSARYEFISNAYVFAHLILSDINGYAVDGKTAEYYQAKFGPEIFWGKRTSISFGFNIGF